MSEIISYDSVKINIDKTSGIRIDGVLHDFAALVS